MKNRDIIIIGLQPWYTDIGSNCKNIALEFAKQNRVLYVNSPLDRNTLLYNKKNGDISRHYQISRGGGSDLMEIQPNLWNYYPHRILESLNWIPSTRVFSFFNKFNNRKFAKDIKRAVSRLGFENYIIFNDNDIFRSFYLKELLKPKAYIYYSRDYLLGVNYWKKHGELLEPLHIAKADIALANSIFLEKFLRKYNSNSHFIGQGCDISLFDTNFVDSSPKDISDIPHPIIGYVGSLNTLRLDVEIIEKISMASSDWQVVLVGPEDEGFKNNHLHQIRNVHFLGKKEFASLPSYVHAFDVCINPQKVNEVTIGNYPLKVDEYLAMGKPVVATKTDAMAMFEDVVYLAEKKEDYITMIKKALREDSANSIEKRIEFARSHTWENTVTKIYSAINNLPATC